jgi:ribonuclease HII
MLRYEQTAYRDGAAIVAGVDEAGRGSLAGPVVAAAVVLPRRYRHATLTDSKLLTAAQREQIYRELTASPAVRWAVGIAPVEIIDRCNILAATWQAMQAAIQRLPDRPDHLLIDGRPVPPIRLAQTAIVAGDRKSFSIAAASVIAKVTRDRLMLQLHEQFPHYNFARHKGYGTPEHLAAIAAYGPSPVHRKFFAPVRHAVEMVQTEFKTGVAPA